MGLGGPVIKQMRLDRRDQKLAILHRLISGRSRSEAGGGAVGVAATAGGKQAQGGDSGEMGQNMGQGRFPAIKTTGFYQDHERAFVNPLRANERAMWRDATKL